MAKQSIDTLAAVVLKEIERHAPHLNNDLKLLVLGKAATMVRVRVADAAQAREEELRAEAIAERLKLEEKRAEWTERMREQERGRKSAFPHLREQIALLQSDTAFVAKSSVIFRAYERIQSMYPPNEFISLKYFTDVWCDVKRKGKAL